MLAESLEQKLTLRVVAEEASGDEESKKRSKPDDLIKVYENLLQVHHQQIEFLFHLRTFKNYQNWSQGMLSRLNLLPLKHYPSKHGDVTVSMTTFHPYTLDLALSYFNASKWNEALALLDRSKDQIQSAKAHHEACASPSQVFMKKLAATDSKIRAFKCEAHARSFLQSLAKETKPVEVSCSTVVSTNTNYFKVSSESKGSLLDSINRFDYSFASSKHLITFPPQFESTKCKPLFFDLAFSRVEFPSLEARKKSKGGWFGFWR